MMVNKRVRKNSKPDPETVSRDNIENIGLSSPEVIVCVCVCVGGGYELFTINSTGG